MKVLVDDVAKFKQGIIAFNDKIFDEYNQSINVERILKKPTEGDSYHEILNLAFMLHLFNEIYDIELKRCNVSVSDIKVSFSRAIYCPRTTLIAGLSSLGEVKLRRDNDFPHTKTLPPYYCNRNSRINYSRGRDSHKTKKYFFKHLNEEIRLASNAESFASYLAVETFIEEKENQIIWVNDVDVKDIYNFCFDKGK
jgi:hypothetical protein